MDLKDSLAVEISPDLLDAIRSWPVQREVEHCGVRSVVSPFATYATCSECGAHRKLRSFSAGGEIEDVFDAVFEWMNQAGAEAIARDRRASLADE